MAGNGHANRHGHQKGCAMCERLPGTVIKRRSLGVKPQAAPQKEQKGKVKK